VADQESKGDAYTEVDFEQVVDEPLKRDQSTNQCDHEDTGRQTVPQPTEADPTVYPADGLTRAFAGFVVALELGHYDIFSHILAAILEHSRSLVRTSRIGETTTTLTSPSAL
jgi:hypothetical protein